MIEPLYPGRIAANHVEVGEAVKADNLLLELDPAEANADALAAQAALDSALQCLMKVACAWMMRVENDRGIVSGDLACCPRRKLRIMSAPRPNRRASFMSWNGAVK